LVSTPLRVLSGVSKTVDVERRRGINQSVTGKEVSQMCPPAGADATRLNYTSIYIYCMQESRLHLSECVGF